MLARRRRRLRILAVATAASVFGFVAFAAHAAWPHRAEVMADVSAVFATPEPAGLEPVAAPVSERPVYRHSVVPGGAYSRAEVADAIKNDAVVAAHYEDIDVERIRGRRVDVPRAVYVSYRKGDQVYWTKNRVRLTAGETVLTDGENEIRARCGNLLSDTAQEPVAAEDPLAALDVADPAPDTDSSTIAGARGPDGTLSPAPFLPGLYGVNGGPFQSGTPGMPGAGTPPMWVGGNGGGSGPYVPSATGTNGTSLSVPLGSTPRGVGDESGGSGSGGGGSTGGGGGSSDDGPKGGGGGGGGEEPPAFVPPTPSGDPDTTTGGTETTGGTVTTGGYDIDTTGGGDTTGGDDTTGADGDDPVRTVPEPGTLVLLGLGACGLASRAVRARRLRQ